MLTGLPKDTLQAIGAFFGGAIEGLTGDMRERAHDILVDWGIARAADIKASLSPEEVAASVTVCPRKAAGTDVVRHIDAAIGEIADKVGRVALARGIGPGMNIGPQRLQATGMPHLAQVIARAGRAPGR